MVKIFVANIAEGVTTSDLKPLFERYGVVDECSILTNFGFVHMSSLEDAEAAVKGVHDTYLSGANIRVEMSHNRPPRRGGGRGGGFRGGRGGGGYRNGFDRGDRRGGFRGDRDRFGGRDRGFERERSRYSRERGRYDDYPLMRERDPYPRESFRDSYRDSLGSRDYDRDPYSRDPYRDSALSRRDSYGRDDSYERRPVPRDRERRDYYARETRGDPFSAASYRDRSPIDRRRQEYAPRYRA